jgi:hypothetical protein
MRGLCFGIVDEADSVLIDEARTPLIISADPRKSSGQNVYGLALGAAAGLTAGRDYYLSESERIVEVNERGKAGIEDFDWGDARSWTNPPQREELVSQALSALHLFERDRHYLVRDGKVQIIDEYTGRLMPDRSWERGLHQMIEIKEGCEPTSRKETLARISYQRFFRRYLRLAGMTGTAREVSRELWSIYRLRVATLPTNRPLRRRRGRNRAYATEAGKWSAIVAAIAGIHEGGRSPWPRTWPGAARTSGWGRGSRNWAGCMSSPRNIPTQAASTVSSSAAAAARGTRAPSRPPSPWRTNWSRPSGPHSCAGPLQSCCTCPLADNGPGACLPACPSVPRNACTPACGEIF